MDWNWKAELDKLLLPMLDIVVHTDICHHSYSFLYRVFNHTL